MRRGKKWFIFWILIPIVVVGAFILLLTHYLLDPNIYRNILQKSLTTALDREISIGKAKIDLWGGVGMAFEDFRIKDRSLAFDLLQSRRLILRVKLLPLLKREIKWRRIIVDRPIFHVIRDKKGQFNIFSDSPLTGGEGKETQKKISEALSSLFGCSLTIRGGEILFLDESLGHSPLKTEIRSFKAPRTPAAATDRPARCRSARSGSPSSRRRRRDSPARRARPRRSRSAPFPSPPAVRR